MSRRICIIEECGAELSEHGRSDFCANCRRWFYYWHKSSPARYAKYREKLRKAESRTEHMPKKERGRIVLPPRKESAT